MLAKKITASLAVLVAAVAVSAPALADRGHRDYRPVHRVVHQHHYVAPRPVVHHYPVHHYYRPAPRPVVVVQQQPAYHRNAGAALLVGAVLGAVIVHAATSGY